LFKVREALAVIDNHALRDNGLRHARLLLVRAEISLKAADDLRRVREAAGFAVQPSVKWISRTSK